MGKYSETLTEHVMSPRNGGVIENADLTGHAGSPGRGAFIILYLRVEAERITAAKYHTVGCGPTIASGSMLTEIIQGQTIAECRDLTAQDLIDALDGVPPDKLHCPALAIGALKDALAKWPDTTEARGRADVARIGSSRSSGTVNHEEQDDRVDTNANIKDFATTEDTEVTELN